MNAETDLTILTLPTLIVMGLALLAYLYKLGAHAAEKYIWRIK